MVQLKVMRRSIRDRIIGIEQQEKRALNDTVRDFFVRIKRLFMHKFRLSHGDRRMTKKLLRLLREFPVDLGMELDQEIESKKAVKRKKTTTTKLIIRDFIMRLKTLARGLENELRMSEEEEMSNVRTIAKLASTKLQVNSAYKGLIDVIEENIRDYQQLCDLWEEMIQAMPM